MKGNRVNNAFQSLKESIRLQINNDELMLDIGNAFYDIGQPQTALKALEYSVLNRATRQSQKNQRKVQEFLLQISKVMNENER